MTDTMGRQLLGIVVTDQDRWKVVEKRVNGIGPGAVQTSDSWKNGRGGGSGNRRQGGKERAARARKSKKTSVTEVDEETMS